MISSSLSFLLAYLLGSLALGSLFLRHRRGLKTAEVSFLGVGLDNVRWLIGARGIAAVVFIDVAKALLALLLLPSAAAAALGLVCGHFYAIQGAFWGVGVRARGLALTGGIWLGLAVVGVVPWQWLALPVLVFVALGLLTRYLSLASLGAVVTAMLLLSRLPLNVVDSLSLMLVGVLVIVRHKAHLMRLVDGVEPKIGRDSFFRGRDPQKVYAAFMIHPMSEEDWWQPKSVGWLRWLYRKGWLPRGWLEAILIHVRPNKYAEIDGITLSDGRQLRVMLIASPMLPELIRKYPKQATNVAIQGASLAQQLGAEAFGLGAFWSTVGNKGLDVQEAVPDLPITNGGAYTAASVQALIPEVMASFQQEHHKPPKAAVVGANGVVAFGIARNIAKDVAELLLIGRDTQRLEKSAQSLRKKFPDTAITCSTDVADCRDSDLIFSATSDPQPLIFNEHLRSGAWVCDLGRPADVAPEVMFRRDISVIPGGVVHPPGQMRSSLDLHFGENCIPACMAETMIMTATQAFDRKSLGAMAKMDNIRYYWQAAQELGFQVAGKGRPELSHELSTQPAAPS